MSRLSESERRDIAQALRKHVQRHADEMSPEECTYYNKLLDDFIKLGTPQDADDQNNLTQLLLAAGM